jgi:hypothetical protein
MLHVITKNQKVRVLGAMGVVLTVGQNHYVIVIAIFGLEVNLVKSLDIQITVEARFFLENQENV